ncbi:MAG TPA: hypothetical protein PLI10_06030, partial [Bacillota bacterium]|nr:hypothetical protein [Bacillota bacterium]
MLISVVEERAIERGKEIGEKAGESRRALAVASRMLDAGEPREKILDYTGIAPEDLDRLAANRRN